MANKITLRTLFDSKKSELEQDLIGMELPKDNQKVQQTVTDYLITLFDSEGDFRQNLTQAEDYLLQATMSLLTAQQKMMKTFVDQTTRFSAIHEEPKDGVINGTTENTSPKKNWDTCKFPCLI